MRRRDSVHDVTIVEVIYHTATLIGRILFRQPTWRMEMAAHPPQMDINFDNGFLELLLVLDFRHIYVVFGSRPG
jgi:hypothetical protein